MVASLDPRSLADPVAQLTSPLIIISALNAGADGDAGHIPFSHTASKATQCQVRSPQSLSIILSDNGHLALP